jgi:hypothetical protein
MKPNVSLAWIAEHMPIKSDAERERYLYGIRRAGLRERILEMVKAVGVASHAEIPGSRKGGKTRHAPK